MSPEQRILELGIHLPTGSLPAGNYVSAIQSGNLLFTSGRAPLPIDGCAARGKWGGNIQSLMATHWRAPRVSICSPS